MAEWASYELSDFLMFSSASYYRMIELYQQALWPGQLIVVGALVFAVIRWRQAVYGPAVALLAFGWVFVGVSFFFDRFSDIFLAATFVAIAFVLQGLLVAIAVFTPRAMRLTFESPTTLRQVAASAMLLVAVFIQPFLATFSGRSIVSADMVLVTPDPTVSATLALLLLARSIAWWLYPIPLLWCAFSGLLLHALQSPGYWLMPALALITLFVRMADSPTMATRR